MTRTERLERLAEIRRQRAALQIEYERLMREDFEADTAEREEQ